MKLQTVSALVVIVSSMSATAVGQERANDRRFTANFHHVDESRPAAPRGTFTRVLETNCHPSRGSLLMRTIQEAGTDPFSQREARAKIAAIRNRMTFAEKKATAKLFRIQANEQKYLAQQAKKEQRIAEREQDREQSHFASAR
jgi:hypothetical protein